MDHVLPIVLCGGSGTRLWPLSRTDAPKPYVPLINGRSLMSLTLERCNALASRVWCVAGENHRFMVNDSKVVAAQRLTLLLEPSPRDTTAAIAWAVARAQRECSSETVLCFMPADHHVPETSVFAKAIQAAANCADAATIVLLGVKPSYASTAYGYIHCQVPEDSLAGTVRKFVEKPTTEIAEQLASDGQHWWNAGVFVGQVQAFAYALAQHAPDIWRAVNVVDDSVKIELWAEGVRFLRPNASNYADIRKQSFDYAVAEKQPEMTMVPLCTAWTDMGSWQALAELQSADANGNRIQGCGYVQAGSNNYVHASSRPVVVVGLDQVHVVETPDAVLVARAGADQALKQAVEALQTRGVPQVRQHRAVHRPWGWYDSVDRGDTFQVKRIVVKPGGVLSLQRHQHRAEHWVVVQGRARVTKGEEVMELLPNTSTFIPQGEVHRLQNVGDEPLVLIEVQTGAYLGEDDIERFEDVYGR